MESVQIIIISPTGATKIQGTLYPQSGLIETAEGWTHLLHEKQFNRAIVPFKEEAPEKAAPVTVERSEAGLESKSKRKSIKAK